MPPTDPLRAPVERSLAAIDWAALTAGRRYHPSPAAWEDEVLYFLMLDRFSDGREFGGFRDLAGAPVSGPTAARMTPRFELQHAGNADPAAWFEAGRSWCGGTLAGLADKLGYLERLGVTALWLSPVFRQVEGSSDYHGYGIQNFLDVDPHFGSREDLRALVAAAHAAGLRVILDVILNHAGDVFAYRGGHRYYWSGGETWPVQGFRTRAGDDGTLPFGPLDPAQHPGAWPEGAVWPAELQRPEAWTRQGEIRAWDAFPEYLDGDFLALKDVDHGMAPKDPGIAWDLLRRIDEFRPSLALRHLAEVYKFWIAFADVDGYRIDTVKHMEPGAVRFFANVIHEFAQSLGKESFTLIGEVTGGRAHAVNVVNTTGIDAALGIDDIQDKLEFLAKGWRSPGDPRTDSQEGYFDLFRNSVIDRKHTHQWYAKHVVVMFDDHDQVGVDHKFRFCSNGGYRFVPVALALNLATAGIPCLYYGTEQALDGADPRTGDDKGWSDAYLRECMFGGDFGSLRSQGRHFFDEDHEIYRLIQELCALRRAELPLRRGRQYLRPVSASGADGDFHFPQPVGGELRWVIAWSRIFAERELLCAVNTDPGRTLRVWATVDALLQPEGRKLSCLFSTDPAQRGDTAEVEARNGSAVRIAVPPCGFVVYG
jgi:glycosidase